MEPESKPIIFSNPKSAKIVTKHSPPFVSISLTPLLMLRSYFDKRLTALFRPVMLHVRCLHVDSAGCLHAEDDTRCRNNLQAGSSKCDMIVMITTT